MSRLLLAVLAASQEAERIRWDARTLFEKGVGAGVALSADEGAVELASGRSS